MKKVFLFLILFILISLNIFECIMVYNLSYIKNISPILGDISAGTLFDPDVVCLAEFSDGISWDKKGIVFSKNDDISKLDNYKVAMSDIIVYNDGYLMMYIGYSDLSTGRLFFAESKDGVN